jgi:hypothetical protein
MPFLLCVSVAPPNVALLSALCPVRRFRQAGRICSNCPDGETQRRIPPGGRQSRDIHPAVEQRLVIAMRISHRVYVMGHGQMVFEGTPGELMANGDIRREWQEV